MSTRSELRAFLRQRLEDTSETPLWGDDALNEFLADAIRQYGIRFPAERTEVIGVTEGSTALTLAGSQDVAEIVAVRGPVGDRVPEERPESLHGVTVQAWRWWGDSVELARPAIGGSWQIDYLARRSLQANDVDPVDVAAGDEAIVVLLAAANALLRRAVELSKRGAETGGLTLTRVADRHAREADLLMQARRRRATGGWFGV